MLAERVPLSWRPFFAPGARLAGDGCGQLLAAALFLGPAALGLSVIMALAPDATKENVIGYRAFPGYFGVHGLLRDVTTVGTWVGPLMILAPCRARQ